MHLATTSPITTASAARPTRGAGLRRLCWVLAVWLLLPLAPARADDYAASGVKALEAGQYEQAVDLLRKATEADAKDFTSLFHLGLAYSLLGKDDEAAAAYRKTLELSPNLYPAELNLGFVLYRQKRYPEAIPWLRKALEAKPRELRPNLYLADALLDSGSPEEADRYYQTALDIDPKAAAAYSGLARVRLARGDYPAALAALDQALNLDPAYQQELLGLASVLEEKNLLDQAAAIYARFPENPAVRERLADLLLRAGKFDEAARQLQEVVRSAPTSASRAALAVAYANGGQPEKALPTLEEAVKIDPDNVELRMIAGRVLRDARQFPSAAQQFHAAVRLQPELAEAWSELAAMLIQVEQYPQALAALHQLGRLGKLKPGHLYLRAITLDKLQQYKEALSAYESFLAASQGANQDQEFLARQRLKVIHKILEKR